MPIPTEPRQPVIYDMMLLAHALLKLRDYEDAKIGRRHPLFCEKQTVFENSLTKIRALAQFMGERPGKAIVSIEDPEFGGSVDKQFMAGLFDRISKYLHHLHEQRYKKEPKYKRPKAADAITAGKQILDTLKPLMDSHRAQLNGDAAHWYAAFEERFTKL